jgi:hypothetical protein
MDLLTVFVMIAPMGLGLAVAIGVLTWTRRVRLAGRRSPLTQGLLRVPGHQLRLKFDDAFTDIMAWMMVAMLIPALLGALYSATFQRTNRWSLVAALIYLVAAVGAIALSAYKMVRLHTRAMDIRMGLDAEMAAGQELDQLMRRGAIVFHDLPAKNFNIDHVLICGAGVFAIETKSRMKPVRDNKVEAKVRFDGTDLCFPGWKDTSSIEQARRQARWLSQELGGAVGELVNVAPVLALPGWFVERTGRSDVRVLNPKSFHFLLEAKEQSLSPELIKRIAYQVERLCRDVAPAYSRSAEGNS